MTRLYRLHAATVAALLLLTVPSARAGDVVSVALEALGGEASFSYKHTTCDVGDCVTGGCFFARCSTPVSCSGGLCMFTQCKTAVCEGGLCTFDKTDTASCPGGGCRFISPKATLDDGYCDGGACTLDGVPHPRKLTYELSL